VIQVTVAAPRPRREIASGYRESGAQRSLRFARADAPENDAVRTVFTDLPLLGKEWVHESASRGHPRHADATLVGTQSSAIVGGGLLHDAIGRCVGIA